MRAVGPLIPSLSKYNRNPLILSLSKGNRNPLILSLSKGNRNPLILSLSKGNRLMVRQARHARISVPFGYSWRKMVATATAAIPSSLPVKPR